MAVAVTEERTAFDLGLDFPVVVAEGTDTMPRAAWLELRRKGIGGSDAAAAAGLSPWKSPYALWCEKTGEYVDDGSSEAALFGQLLETVVANEFATRQGLSVVTYPALLAHPDYPWMLANVDRFVVDDAGQAVALLECKTTGLRLEDEWADDDLPDHHAMQVHHYLAVTGLPRAYVSVLIGGQRMPEPRIVERDEQMIDNLIKIEEAFWSLVQEHRAPSLDGSDSTRNTLRGRYDTAVPQKQVEVDVSTLNAIHGRAALRDEIKRLEADCSRYEAEIMAALGDAEIATYLGETVCTWKSQTRKAHAVAESTFRTLRISKAGMPL